MRRASSVSVRIAVIYAAAGAAWILISNRLLVLAVGGGERVHTLQALNGWLFVVVSAVLIGWLVQRELQSRRRTEVALRGSRLREQRAHRAVAEARGEAATLRGLAETAGHTVQRQVQRLSALRAIDIAIAGSVDQRVTLSIILDQVTARLGVDAAAVHVLDARLQTLVHAASRGFRKAGIERTRQRLGDGYAGQVAVERHTLFVPDLARAENFLRASLVEGEGFRAYVGVPLVTKGQLRGVMELFHRSPLEADDDWFEFLEALAGQCVIALEHVSMFDGLQRANTELALAYDRTLEGWSHALELRDYETKGHSDRVTRLTLRLAERLGMSEEECIHIRRGALLHDIGKMGIPDRILLKPTELTDEEWHVMRRHPVYAYDLLHVIPFLREALDIPYCHHEYWDGSGYPRGLCGEQIPVTARIFTVVDIWDALTHDRPYRHAWPAAAVREYIGSLAGRKLDPSVARAFLSMDVHAMA